MAATGIKTILYPVSDVATGKALLTAVTGVAPEFDAPYYAGWRLDGQDIGLTVQPYGHVDGMTGPIAYWHVDDIQATLQALRAAGAEPQRDPKDVGGGRLVATVKDADGNVIGLVQEP